MKMPLVASAACCRNTVESELAVESVEDLEVGSEMDGLSLDAGCGMGRERMSMGMDNR